MESDRDSPRWRRWTVLASVLVTILVHGALVGCSDDSAAGPDALGNDAPSQKRDGGKVTTPPSEPAPDSDPGEDGGADSGASPDSGPPENRNMGLSAGCSKPNAGTGLQSRKSTIAGVERTYLRFIPPSYDPTKPLATVIALHGSGGTAAKARESFDLEASAKGKAIFIYPQALPSPDPKYDGANRWDPTMGSDDYAFFDALVTDVETTHCVDRDRLFVAGFSLGARFTSMLGCYRGDKIRAIAPVAPGMNAATLPLAAGPCVGEVAVWEGLGDEDDDHEMGSLIVRDYYRTTNGCSTTLVPTPPTGCRAYQGCRAEVPVVWCTYPGGHKWPAIRPSGVWGFFAKFM